MSGMSQLNEVEARFFESGGQDVPPPELTSTEGTESGQEDSAPSETGRNTSEERAIAAEKESREGRFVPLQALQEERAEKKQLREELRQYREWQAQLTQRLQRVPVQQDVKPIPDPQTKPLEYINHVLGNMQATTAELQQWRQQQEAASNQQTAMREALEWAEEQGRDYSQTQPEYPDAFRYAEEARDKELKALGYRPSQRAAILRTNHMEVIQNAMQQGRNPAELVWEYARARGFMPKGNRPDADATAKIAAGLQAAGGKLNKGGATGEGDISAKDLANISDPEDFEKAWRRVFGRTK